MNEFIAVLTITVLAVISPGADFAIVIRNSYTLGRSSGMASALGIALGVQTHILYTSLGLSKFISNSPKIFIALKISGAAYLIYIGLRSFLSKSPKDPEPLSTRSDNSTWISFKEGFLTNTLNPKTMLFIIATFTQAVAPESSISTYIFYGLLISGAHLLWFSFVAVFFSNYSLRHRLTGHLSTINKIIGIIFIILGTGLILPSVAQF